MKGGCMRTKRERKAVILVFLVIFLLSFMGISSIKIKSAKTTVNYDRNGAYNYANYYWDEVCSDGYYIAQSSAGDTYAVSFPLGTSYLDVQDYFDHHDPKLYGADCAHFVSCCIGDDGGGGLPVPHNYHTDVYGYVSATGLANWILDNDYGVEKDSINDLEMGDVILFNWDGGTKHHIVIYLGNGKVASHSVCKPPTTDWTYFLTSMTVGKFIHINTDSGAKSDLITQNLQVTPNHGVAGSNATVSFRIYNQGAGVANANTTNIRIKSSTGHPTVSDPLLASLSIPSIPAGGYYDVSQSVTIPSDSPTGTNYIWVILDVNHTANQSNEDNDYASVVFTVDSSCTLPSVTTNAATSVTQTSATLNATINPKGQWTEALFFYGEDPNNLSSLTTFAYVGSDNSNHSFSQTISGLKPNTKYYFQVYAEVSCGGADGNILNFTTLAACNPPSTPSLTSPSNGATGVSLTPTFQWTASSGTSPITYTLQISTSSNFSPLIFSTSGISTTSYTLPSGNLTNGITYYWRVQATNSCGNSNFSSTYYFTTVAACNPPSVTTSAAANITQTSATLNSTINPNGQSTTAWFQYGLTTSYGSETAHESVGTGSISYPKTVSGLSPGTTYHFRVVAQNACGITYGGDLTFTTLAANNPGDQIGVYRPSDRRFYMRSPTGTVTAISFGRTGDTPIIGDWNGDGKDEIGVYRPSDRRFYMRSPTGTVTAISFGRTGDTPIIGKWQ